MQIEVTNNGLTIEADSEAETDRIGRALAGVVEPGTVIGLVGPLGAGKTRLVRSVAEALGVDPGAIASPTFVLIHEYEGRLPVAHFDVYRLASPEEFEALGPADYWEGDRLCLIEWADRVADRLPASTWTIRIEPRGPVQRRFVFEFPESSGIAKRLAEALDPSKAGRFDASRGGA